MPGFQTPKTILCDLLIYETEDGTFALSIVPGRIVKLRCGRNTYTNARNISVTEKIAEKNGKSIYQGLKLLLSTKRMIVGNDRSRGASFHIFAILALRNCQVQP